jgi:hypothetical protein
MTDYVWQLGIDWNAIQTGGVSYLRGGLTEDGVPVPGTATVSSGDTIIFRIFDVSSSGPPMPTPVPPLPPGWVTTIGSFVILTKAAVNGQVICNSLSNLQPAIGPPDVSPEQQSLFGPAYCSWTYAPVTVTATAPARFLLTTQVQAIGTDNAVRLFSHDPEMVVGGTGG